MLNFFNSGWFLIILVIIAVASVLMGNGVASSKVINALAASALTLFVAGQFKTAFTPPAA